MSSQDTIRLLVINDSQAEVERLLSMLRNAGKTTRPQHVPSKEGLEKLLTDQAWDLLIGLDGAKSCDIKEAIRSIKKLDKDVPVIIQADVADDSERTVALIEGLKAGARDVVVLDDDQHLLLVMDRELQNLAERRERRATDRKFNASERRSQQLLDSSRDAIAYVEDGMFLYLNQSFAEMFGYTDPDDVLALPIVDMIADKNQDTYVQFMKSFKMADSAGSQELRVKGIKSTGDEFDTTLTVSHATHDDEACVQLKVEGVGAATVTAPAAVSGTIGAPPAPTTKPFGIDSITGLHDRRYMMDVLTNAVQEAAEQNRYRSLYYISVDRFTQVRNNLGFADTDAMLASLANCLKSSLESGATLAHFSDEEFMLLVPGIDSEQHRQKATELCKKVEAHICSAGAKSVQVTISIGIAPISESATNPDEIIKRAHTASDEARSEGKDGVGNRAKIYAPKISGSGGADDSTMLEIIRHALTKEAFGILFQPVVSLQGDENEYYEVLINVKDGSGKTVDTGMLFKAVESDKDLAVKLDRWTILKATKMLAQHRAKHPKTHLMINLASASIQDATLPQWLGVALKAGNVPASSLVFQISENDAANYLNQAKTFTDGVRAMGAHSCIKHFGCSLDPFKALSHLTSISFIKLDGSFSSDIQKKNEDPKALKALVGKLTEAGKKSIVPFVENATMMATLWQSGAHYIQGHYIQAPTENMNFQFSEE